jgi:tripartite-type tricarboxylate transporter receptor subunit TctC
MRAVAAALAVVLSLAAALERAAAQSYPTRPITIVVPTTAGGPPDTLARLLGERMRVTLGQPIVVENTTGAGGTLGMSKAARAAPDGYTLSIGHLNSHVFSAISYGLSSEALSFEPIALLTIAPMVFGARIGFPPNDMASLIAWLKANPDKATMGAVGVGGPATVWGAQFRKNTGATFQLVPYRGAFAIVQDVVAGQIDLTCVEASNIVPHLNGGKIKLYAVLAKTRWAAAPNVPTIEETGAPLFPMPFWHALWAPKGTPKDIVARLNDAAVKALVEPAVKARLAQIGQDTFPPDQLTPQALGAYHRAEVEKWTPVIRDAGIKAN